MGVFVFFKRDLITGLLRFTVQEIHCTLVAEWLIGYLNNQFLSGKKLQKDEVKLYKEPISIVRICKFSNSWLAF